MCGMHKTAGSLHVDNVRMACCEQAKADGEDAKVKLGFAIMCTANTTTTVVTSEVVAVVDAVVDIANLDSGTSMVSAHHLHNKHYSDTIVNTQHPIFDEPRTYISPQLEQLHG